jgi:hypothetical protein
MKRNNKIAVYVIVCVLVTCAVIGGMWGGIKEWQNSIHYVGETEVPLNIALSLQHIPYTNGEGEVKIIDTSCPSGNVVIRYDLYSANKYSYLTSVNERCDGQLVLVGEGMTIFSLLGSGLCCCLASLFLGMTIRYKGKKDSKKS